MDTSLALRSGLDPGRLVRTLEDKYTGSWRDVDTILYQIESVVRRLPTYKNNTYTGMFFKVDV